MPVVDGTDIATRAVNAGLVIFETARKLRDLGSREDAADSLEEQVKTLIGLVEELRAERG